MRRSVCGGGVGCGDETVDGAKAGAVMPWPALQAMIKETAELKMKSAGGGGGALGMKK